MRLIVVDTLPTRPRRWSGAAVTPSHYVGSGISDVFNGPKPDRQVSG